MSGAAIIRKQNRLIKKFREANAINPQNAVLPEDIGCPQRWIFRRLAARGVFVPVGEGKFYMDEETARNFVERRREKVLTISIILMAAFLLYLLLR